MMATLDDDIQVEEHVRKYCHLDDKQYYAGLENIEGE